MLVGNKRDLVDHNKELRDVPEDEIQAFVKKHGVLYLETSAVADYQIEDTFTDLLQEIYYTVNSRKIEPKKEFKLV